MLPMNEDRPSEGPAQRSWLGRLGQALLGEPHDLVDLVDLLRDAHRRGLLDHDALQMIEGVLEVAEMRVDDIMIPRSQMVVVSRDDPPQELIRIAIESGHSRFPVIGDSRDEVVGILLAKDLLASAGDPGFNVRDVLRPPVFIPESKRLDALLKDFRSSRNHLAMVVDEYGGVAGIVSASDVLREVLGEMPQDFGGAPITPERLPDGRVRLPGRLPVDRARRWTGGSWPARSETVAGAVLDALGHLPAEGERTVVGGVEVEVERMEENAVVSVLSSVREEAEDG